MKEKSKTKSMRQKVNKLIYRLHFKKLANYRE